jgi:tetratricopeptide (TPR) repeat protein
MANRTCWCVIPVALLALLFIPANITAQDSKSRNNPAEAPSGITSDAELDAISKSEQEGRLLDAEKLLTAAVHNAESNSAPRLRLSVLLNSLARVEYDLRQYSEAVSAKQKELEVDKDLYHPESAKVLIDLYALAMFNREAGNQAAADQAMGEELTLARKVPGPHEVTLVTALWEASQNDRQAHRNAEAQALLAEGAQICQAPGAMNTNICPLVLSSYYEEAGETVQAEKILSDAAAQGPVDYHGHADFGPQLNALGQLAAHYEQGGSYELAEATYLRAIAVAEDHIPNPLVAPGVYDDFGRLLELEGNNEEAEAAYKHAFDTLEHMQGRFQFVAIERLSDTPLVRLYQQDGRTSEAEAVLEQVLTDQEQTLDPNDAHLARTLLALAGMKYAGGKYSEAEPLCEGALKIQEADYGPDNPQLQRALNTCAGVERHLGNVQKADTLAGRASALRQEATPNSLPAR